MRNVTEDTGPSSSNEGKPGDVLEYCVAYSNPGQSPVTNVEVTDTIPTTTTPPLTSVADYANGAIRWRVTVPTPRTQNLSAAADPTRANLLPC